MSEPRDKASAHEHYGDDLAAYALGALEKGEAEELRHHLEECDACRQQLRWLQPAIDLLPRSVPQREPPPRLRKQLMATVRAESREAARAGRARSRRRDWGARLWRPATAVAATTLLAVGAAAGYLFHQPADSSSVVAAHPTGSAPDAASGTLERQDDSAILHVEGMPSLARNQVYEAWVLRDGRFEPSSLFMLRNHRGDAAIQGPLEGADEVLVTREPHGGSRQPTSPPLLRADLN